MCKKISKMRIILFVCFFVGFVLIGKAQINQELHNDKRDEAKMKKLREKWDEAQGTFQIQIVNSRKNPQVDVAIIDNILKVRKKEEIIYIPLMEDVRIMVLPLSKIQSSDFKKIELYKYVSE